MSRKLVIVIVALLATAVGVFLFRTPSRSHAVEPVISDVVSRASEEAPLVGEVAPSPVTAASAPGQPPVTTPAESALMAELRATLGKGTPQATLDLGRKLERLYPDGVLAEERSLYVIDALIALDRIPDMRDEARRHLAKWPGTETSDRVMARTGVHPELRPAPNLR